MGVGAVRRVRAVRWGKMRDIVGAWILTLPVTIAAGGAAYLLLRGMKTLALRVERQNASAARIAAFLDDHSRVARVFYPGLPGHDQHDVAARQMRGFGGVLSFQLDSDDFDAVRRFLPKLRFAHRAANLGAVETVVAPPATGSHVELTAEERARAGIPETLIRYSVGIEDPDDLIADLEQALTQ